MKKTVLATLLSLAAFSAIAAEVRIEGQNLNGQNGTADQKAFEFSVKENLNNNFAGDLTVMNFRTDNTNALTSRVEAGLTASQTLKGVVPITPFVRGAVGEKFVSGSNNFSYYSVEPGVAVAVVPNLTAVVSWRYQDAFTSNKNDQTRTWRTKVGYDVSKNDTLYIGYDVQRGDFDANIARVGYVRRF